MKRFVSILCVLMLLLSSSAALAENSFAGTWTFSKAGYKGQMYPAEAFPTLMMVLEVREDQNFPAWHGKWLGACDGKRPNRLYDGKISG